MSLDKFRKNGKIDYWILILVFALCLFGLLMIYSSSAVLSYENYGVNNYFFKKQLLSVGIGLVLLLVASAIDYRFWRKYAPIIMGISIILLLGVFLSPKIAGAHRWFKLGSFQFQPSELTKITFIIYFAAWLAKRKENVRDFKTGFLPFLAILGVIGFLIIKQPDMGTMTVIVSTAVIMFFSSGASLGHMSIGLLGMGGLFYILIKSAPYRLQRFLIFLNPTSEKLGAGYHINQAQLAIGSGGWLGLGFGQSKQKYLYLPEPHTDSIFAIITEELGFIRAFIVLAFFLIIGLRGMKIAKKAPDDFAKFLVIGITAWIIIQFLINIGAMIGVMPLTGIPLPFVSYGGSSVIVLLFSIGILLNISKQSNS